MSNTNIEYIDVPKPTKGNGSLNNLKCNDNCDIPVIGGPNGYKNIKELLKCHKHPCEIIIADHQCTNETIINVSQLAAGCYTLIFEKGSNTNKIVTGTSKNVSLTLKSCHVSCTTDVTVKSLTLDHMLNTEHITINFIGTSVCTKHVARDTVMVGNGTLKTVMSQLINCLSDNIKYCVFNCSIQGCRIAQLSIVPESAIPVKYCNKLVSDVHIEGSYVFSFTIMMSVDKTTVAINGCTFMSSIELHGGVVFGNMSDIRVYPRLTCDGDFNNNLKIDNISCDQFVSGPNGCHKLEVSNVTGNNVDKYQYFHLHGNDNIVNGVNMQSLNTDGHSLVSLEGNCNIYHNFTLNGEWKPTLLSDEHSIVTTGVDNSYMCWRIGCKDYPLGPLSDDSPEGNVNQLPISISFGVLPTENDDGIPLNNSNITDLSVYCTLARVIFHGTLQSHSNVLIDGDRDNGDLVIYQGFSDKARRKRKNHYFFSANNTRLVREKGIGPTVRIYDATLHYGGSFLSVMKKAWMTNASSRFKGADDSFHRLV